MFFILRYVSTSKASLIQLNIHNRFVAFQKDDRLKTSSPIFPHTFSFSHTFSFLTADDYQSKNFVIQILTNKQSNKACV